MVKYVGGRKKLHHFLTTFKPYIRTKAVIYKVVVWISLPCIKLSSYIYMYKTTKFSMIKLGRYQVYEYGLDELYNLQWKRENYQTRFIHCHFKHKQHSISHMTGNSYMKVHYTSSVTVKLIGMRLLYRMMKVRNDMPRFCAFLPGKKVNTHVINTTLYLKTFATISSWILKY